MVFDNNKKTGISPIVEFGYGDKLFDETKKNVCLSNMEYGTVANNIVVMPDFWQLPTRGMIF